MLPVCSATPSSSHSLIFLNDGLRFFSRSQKSFDATVTCLSGDTSMSSLSRGVCSGAYLQKEALYSNFAGGHKSLANDYHYSTRNISNSFFIGREHLTHVEDSAGTVLQEDYVGDAVVNNPDILLKPATKESTSILDNINNSPDILLESTPKEPTSILDSITDSTASSSPDVLLEAASKEPTSLFDYASDNAADVPDVPDGPSMNTESIPSPSINVEDFLSQTNESIGASLKKGEDALISSVDKGVSAIQDIIKSNSESFEKLTNKVLSSIDQSGEATRDRLSNLPVDLKEASSKVGAVALELLRKAIPVAEDSLVKGTKFVYYTYETSKEFLSPEVKNALNSFEEKTTEISKPVAMVFVQVYSAIEGLERSVGLDPSDPVVPFVLLVGTTSTLWTIHWVVTYSGYAGDLPPESAMELLKGKDSAVLVDVRPEDLKQQDGIPDLRRTARFRYADVPLLKVDGPVRKLLKSSKDLDDSSVATVICNLKNVQDRSKILVMDADGTSAKGIARSLRKLGIKKPYVLQGGFHSWVKQGLRVKELKPETPFTILNEEAEAILEELSPSPAQLFAFSVGSIAAFYALLEWEKSLQLIGVFGLALTVYRRLASYEDSEAFRQDVRLLLSPVTLGAQVLTSATGKVETNGNGLPVSPSSSDVQSRVLQAAAKHESQPSDAEASQESMFESTTAVNETADPPEA